jgi:hypothetical protein
MSLIGLFKGNLGGNPNDSLWFRWDKVDGFRVFEEEGDWYGAIVVSGTSYKFTEAQISRSAAEDIVTSFMEFTVDPPTSGDFQVATPVEEVGS